jgi:hypothetical protein
VVLGVTSGEPLATEKRVDAATGSRHQEAVKQKCIVCGKRLETVANLNKKRKIHTCSLKCSLQNKMKRQAARRAEVRLAKAKKDLEAYYEWAKITVPPDLRDLAAKGKRRNAKHGSRRKLGAVLVF